MQVGTHVRDIQQDLAAAAALGDDATAEAARRLSQALESSLQLRLLDVLTEVALDVSGQLPAGHVEVRLAGRDPELVFVDEQADAAGAVSAPGDELSARITLRLPEKLKTAVEAAADREGVSTNTWIVRALARALEPRTRRSARRGGNRLRGFAQS
jgi:hypothetical protein